MTPPAFTPPVPRLDFVARVSVDLTAPIWELGATTDLGRRRIIPITGGTIDGPRLNGRILDNGADWQIVTEDGLALIETRYLLELDDGALAYLQTRGYRHGPADIMADVAAGRPVDPALYYFRISLTFETASVAYAWLNRTLFIGAAMRLGQAVVYDAYAVE